MWNHGQVITRREILGFAPADEAVTIDTSRPWHGKPWLTVPVHVVADTDDHLVTYLAEGAPFTFPPGQWPVAGGRHPWSNRTGWSGHGCLMVQRPGEHHAVWHFWEGPNRDFSHWYINLQTAFQRTADGYDTQDLELDLIVKPDGSWELKDDEYMEQRVAEGRYTAELVAWIRNLADELIAELKRGNRWWDEAWAEWNPPSEWRLAKRTGEPTR